MSVCQNYSEVNEASNNGGTTCCKVSEAKNNGGATCCKVGEANNNGGATCCILSEATNNEQQPALSQIIGRFSETIFLTHNTQYKY